MWLTAPCTPNCCYYVQHTTSAHALNCSCPARATRAWIHLLCTMEKARVSVGSSYLGTNADKEHSHARTAALSACGWAAYPKQRINSPHQQCTAYAYYAYAYANQQGKYSTPSCCTNPIKNYQKLSQTVGQMGWISAFSGYCKQLACLHHTIGRQAN